MGRRANSNFRAEESSSFPLPVSDQSPIFHGSGTKIGNSGHVLLRQRVLNVEQLFVEFENFGTDVGSETNLNTLKNINFITVHYG